MEGTHEVPSFVGDSIGRRVMKDNEHSAVAIDWNGKRLEVTFKLATKDVERLYKAAHKAFHRKGKFTIELDLVDLEEVPHEFRYMA